MSLLRRIFSFYEPQTHEEYMRDRIEEAETPERREAWMELWEFKHKKDGETHDR